MSRPTTAELQTAAVKGSIWTSFHATLSLPLTVLVNIIVARVLGPIEFGYLATLIAAYGLATTVANMGVSDATIQWGASYHVRGATEDLVELVRRCAGYHLIIETPLIVAVTAVMLRSASWETQLAGCLAAGGGMAIGTSSVVQTLLSRTATIARISLVITVALQVSVAIAAASSESGLVTWTARIVIASVVPVVLFFLLPRTLRSAVLRPLAPWRWPQGFLPYAVKAGLAALVSMLVFSRSEIFVLQAHDLAVAAGVYALAFGIAAQLTAPVDALLGPMFPAAASLAAAAPERLAPALLRGLRFTSLIAGSIAAIGIPAASALIVVIYGEQFHSVEQLLLPLALASCIQSLNHPVTAFMYGTRRVGAMLLINAIAFAVDISLALATIGSLHVWGAVLANATGQIISLGGAATLLCRNLSLPLTALVGSLRMFLEGAVAAGCGWLVANVLTPASLPAEAKATLGLLVGGFIFVGFQQLRQPGLTREDMATFAKGMPSGIRRPVTRTLSLLRFSE